ncbi:MAG: glycosyltransferase family 4 protein [bacterium]
MAFALGEAGYVVDVADVRTPQIPASAGLYDLILTHHPSLALIQDHLTSDAKVVYLAAGMNHAECNRRVNARRAAIQKRRLSRIPPYEVNDEMLSVLSRADAIAGFGNQSTMGTWARAFSGPIFPFDNSGFGWIRQADEVARDYASHFLFFGSVDQVRKGLDLLLEVFPKHPDLHLHVAGHYEREPEFCACYDHELRQTANIHTHGVVVIGSKNWDSLIKQCAFVILPSCGEGQAGSVIQAMYAGLIPVVTPAAGIDVSNCGFVLEGEPPDALERDLLRLASLPEATLRERRELTLQVAHGKYSAAAFESRWLEIAKAFCTLPPFHHV